MTDAAVRPEVEEASRLPEPLTIGALARWSAALQNLDPRSYQEGILINEQWIEGLKRLAAQQEVEHLGGIAYIVDQEAQQLLRKGREK